jgi:putative ABC transport system permease protein
MVKLIGENDSRCYILANPASNINLLQEKFARDKASIPNINDGSPSTYYLKDLQSAYFDKSRGMVFEKNRNETDLKIALVIALMILSVALFNYIGLINNRLTDKTREYSIRRINGGSKVSLINNFLSETLVLTATAFLLSLTLMNLIIPFFNQS